MTSHKNHPSVAPCLLLQKILTGLNHVKNHPSSGPYLVVFRPCLKTFVTPKPTNCHMLTAIYGPHASAKTHEKTLPLSIHLDFTFGQQHTLLHTFTCLIKHFVLSSMSTFSQFCWLSQNHPRFSMSIKP